jgi:undecaprenyl phosphate-alpha-L-ara4N flippase subunit ArnE
LRNLAPLLIIPLLISVGQLLFKQASVANSGLITINRTISFLTNPYLLVALAIYFGSTLWWIVVLRDTALSRAYGFMALSFVYVPLLSWIFLNESISARMVFGTLLIAVGLTTIATSDPLISIGAQHKDPVQHARGEIRP